jgi:hypothetical protein
MTGCRPAAYRAARLVGTIALAACRSDSTAPPEGACTPALAAVVGTSGDGVPQVVRGDAASCLRAATAGTYLVVTQLANGDAPVGRYAAQIGTPAGPVEGPPGTLSLLEAPVGSAADRLHALARAVERRPVSPRATMPLLRRELPTVGASGTFSVLRTLSLPEAYAPVTARAAFVGRHVVVYVDTATPPVFSADDWQALGRQFDDDLYPVDTAAFGPPSDLDGNGRVIVLFTPVVNALVSELECARFGFVNGFFFGHDLQSTAPTSNQGEVFYAYVPDPAGRFSCPHGGDEVRRTLPPTFVHELQHMISYAAHVLARGGTAEETWLNEGLSHVAETLGGRLYEGRWPPPGGRSSPGRLLPDSAVPFTLPNIAYANDWLSFPTANSVTRLAPDSPGSLPERGAALLLLRWLEGQRGTPAFRDLVQTSRTGWRNVESVVGRPFADVFADLGAALWLDSVPGRPRPSDPRFRVAGRALRREFLELNQVNPARAPQPFPLAPLSVSRTARRVLGLPSGGMGFFSWQAEAGALLRVARADDRPFGEALGAQVVVIRQP